ncbi:hypothetical protein NDU88_009246 [Pleurodeles waltl]|uniref:Uncharacterized protein n=1 Tax=Pleurodeles waltl TaxID=8319 RepID=A0AAV7RXY2_PLEWA|nr:hypothetical protein NDU88_009246 [Pleurodeles waltl]
MPRLSHSGATRRHTALHFGPLLSVSAVRSAPLTAASKGSGRATLNLDRWVWDPSCRSHNSLPLWPRHSAVPLGGLLAFTRSSAPARSSRSLPWAHPPHHTFQGAGMSPRHFRLVAGCLGPGLGERRPLLPLMSPTAITAHTGA